MAGLTNEGLVIKRLGEVIADLKEAAIPIFQDLVPPGDIVDTGDSSTIGRFIGLISPGYADLWEAAAQVNWAFDPNAATGIALDNLVMYGGLTRNPASATQATVIVWGDENTAITTTEQVRSVDNNLYSVVIPVTLTRSLCNGFEVSIPSVVSGQTYGLGITSGASTVVASVVAAPLDTPATVTEKLRLQIAVNTWLVAENTTSGNLRVTTANHMDYISFTPTNNNVVVRKIRSRTEVINTEIGAIEQPANTITTIATPVLGWDSVTNPEDAVVGENAETDEELRIRFRESKFIRAQNIMDALYSALLEVDGVISAGIFENDTDTYDPVFELPPHSFKSVVLGGNPNDIAQAIWKNKPLGIAPIGNTPVPITDSQGFIREIKFDRPTNVDVYITMEIKSVPGVFPANGPELIKANLIQYFQDNFSIGDEVVYSRLYTPINQVQGHQVNSLFIGTSPNPTGTTNIPIAYNQLAALKASDIVITVV